MEYLFLTFSHFRASKSLGYRRSKASSSVDFFLEMEKILSKVVQINETIFFYFILNYG